jgi:hypothetical protein
LKDVFILGAGFSKAICEHMPLLNDLYPATLAYRLAHGQHVDLGTEKDDDTGSPRVVEDLELFLSFLAQEQPWLTEAENFRNRAEFLEVSRAIAAIILDSQNLAVRDDMPHWLADLIRAWHRDQPVVITFNYDALVEKAASAIIIEKEQPFPYSLLYPVPITNILLRTAGTYGVEPVETFRLLKLHGSLNWYYSGSSSFYGEQIYDILLKGGWSPDHTDSEEELEERAIDKVPLIVPPTLNKSLYFNNETVRSQWILARRALADAARIFIIGYSLPQGDLIVNFMLALVESEATIIPVNPDVSLSERLAEVFPRERIDTTYLGLESAVQSFAETYDRDSRQEGG